MRYRKIYEHCYGPIPKGWDIHHIDGNKNNNHPANLEALPKEKHYKRHMKQKDYAAALAIAMRMKITPKEFSKIARSNALEQVKKGTHPFLGPNINYKHCRERVANGTHNFLGGKIQHERVKDGTHNLLGITNQNVVHVCSRCGKTGKGPGMYNHFKVCKEISREMS